MLTIGQIAKELNLVKILESHANFRDLEKLQTSPDYVEEARQLGPPIFSIH
jgi:hypothetical protein